MNKVWIIGGKTGIGQSAADRMKVEEHYDVHVTDSEFLNIYGLDTLKKATLFKFFGDYYLWNFKQSDVIRHKLQKVEVDIPEKDRM